MPFPATEFEILEYIYRFVGRTARLNVGVCGFDPRPRRISSDIDVLAALAEWTIGGRRSEREEESWALEKLSKTAGSQKTARDGRLTGDEKLYEHDSVACGGWRDGCTLRERGCSLRSP